MSNLKKALIVTGFIFLAAIVIFLVLGAAEADVPPMEEPNACKPWTYFLEEAAFEEYLKRFEEEERYTTIYFEKDGRYYETMEFRPYEDFFCTFYEGEEEEGFMFPEMNLSIEGDLLYASLPAFVGDPETWELVPPIIPEEGEEFFPINWKEYFSDGETLQVFSDLSSAWLVWEIKFGEDGGRTFFDVILKSVRLLKEVPNPNLTTIPTMEKEEFDFFEVGDELVLLDVYRVAHLVTTQEYLEREWAVYPEELKETTLKGETDWNGYWEEPGAYIFFNEVTQEVFVVSSRDVILYSDWQDEVPGTRYIVEEVTEDWEEGDFGFGLYLDPSE